MVYQPDETLLAPEDTKTPRIAVRQNAAGGFVFFNHYQRLRKLDDWKDVVVETASVTFPPLAISGEIAFILPFLFSFCGQTIRYATAQLLCRQGNTLFFAEVPGIPAEYDVEGDGVLHADAGSVITIDDLQIVTVTWEEALYLRKLDHEVYIGEHCDLYREDGKITSIGGQSFAYRKWDGNAWIRREEVREEQQAVLSEEIVPEPFAPTYETELNLGGERKRVWKKLQVSSDRGFVELDEVYDVAQIYADGVLVADNFYAGEPWRIPAKLIFQKEAYLAASEIRDDFYREFS